MKLLTGKFSIAIIITLCIVSRLPQLLSNNLILDGDECVLALMAKHMYSLKEFPLFFYGQAYDLSFIECLSIMLFYTLGGITTISVKLGMLLLWAIGVAFLYKTFLKINNGDPWVPFLLILIFICAPAWALGSMNMSGYITSFMLTSILLNLIFDEEIKKPFFTGLLIAIILALIFESEPLWIPGLCPLLCYKLYERGVKNTLTVLVLSAGFIILFYFYKQGLSHFYTPPTFYAGKELLPNLNRIPIFLFSSLHGYYFSYQVQKPVFFAAFFAYSFCTIILFLCVMALYNIIKGNKGTLLFNLSVLSVTLTLLYTIFSREIHPRYLLPITGWVLLSCLLFIQTITVREKLMVISSSIMIITGSLAIVSLKDFQFSTMRKNNLGQLITYLEKNHVYDIYCYDYMLTYQVIFYSHEQILSRERGLPGRYPPYSKQVDSVLNNGGKTALLYNELQLRDMQFKEINRSSGYLIVFDPPKNELEKIFQFGN